jgi:hypothetical protein
LHRRKVLQQLEKAWQDFQDSHSGLSDSLLTRPGVTKAWSVRDILAHVTTWEEEALKHLPLVLQGGRPPRYSTTYGGIDAFNALMTEHKKHLPLRQVLEEQRTAHRRLLEFLETVPDRHFRSEARFRRRLRLDTYSHYPKHAQAIRNWRAQL